MNIHAVICTRSSAKVSEITQTLLSYFVEAQIQVVLLSAATSIFKAYLGAYKKIQGNPEDIIIFCHDDIAIKTPPEEFKKRLTSLLEDDTTGFVGPAGTTYLGGDAVWWEHHKWEQGYHRGVVHHYNEQKKEVATIYGKPDDVVVLDGLFLAAKCKTLDNLDLKKPEYFEGAWDFYDIYYTSQAYLRGYTNKILDMHITHHSNGELVGRDSWHKNRTAFIANTELPLQIFP